MRQRVTLQRLTETPDAFSQAQPTWTDVGTFWAKVKGASGKEVAIARQLQAQVTHSVTMRYIGVITPADRFLYAGRLLNITEAINVDERKREWQLLCTETV